MPLAAVAAALAGDNPKLPRARLEVPYSDPLKTDSIEPVPFRKSRTLATQVPEELSFSAI